MVFYYNYEKELSKARVTVIENNVATDYLVDKVVCHVPTTTERQDAHPKFRVCGICKRIELYNMEIIYIY